MVNKAALSVLGVIVLASMGVGVLIGMQIGGGGAETVGASTPTADESSRQAPSSDGADPPARTTIPGGEMATVQPPDDEETIPARRFEAKEISREIERLLNQRRTSRDLSELLTSGRVTGELDALAHSHSVAMADDARVSHTIDGNSSRNRYESAELYGACQFKSDAGSYVVDARYNRLELVSHAVAGRVHDGEFLKTEEEVAQAIVSDWSSGTSRDRVFYENANQVGVGVEVTQSGDVYVTGNLC
jgi:hypothetical protein